MRNDGIFRNWLIVSKSNELAGAGVYKTSREDFGRTKEIGFESNLFTGQTVLKLPILSRERS